MIKEIVKKIFSKFGRQIVLSHTHLISIRQMRLLLYMSRMYSLIEGVEGDIVECGVGKGRTFLYLTHLMYTESKNRTLYGFDSFEGFPKPTQEDASERNPQEGEWSGVSPQDIVKILLNAGFDPNWIDTHIVLVKGFVEETLSSSDLKKVALLHIDLDLYSAYKVTLSELYSLVSQGGVILFDEYGEKFWPGATKAVNEFLEKEQIELQHDEIINKYYILKQ